MDKHQNLKLITLSGKEHPNPTIRGVVSPQNITINNTLTEEPNNLTSPYDLTITADLENRTGSLATNVDASNALSMATGVTINELSYFGDKMLFEKRDKRKFNLAKNLKKDSLAYKLLVRKKKYYNCPKCNNLVEKGMFHCSNCNVKIKWK